jgi:nucleotide-binding universal stress UspA family protein
MRSAARKRLAETMTALGLTGEIEVTIGPPSDAIVKVAEEKGADLVVIGTSGRSGIDRLLLGSVAKAVIRHAPCSVLVARPAAQARRKTGVARQPEAPL